MRAARCIIAGLCVAACGGRGGEHAPLAVSVEGPIAASTPPYVAAPTLAERTRAVASAAAVAWGASPEILQGWQVTFAQTPFACGDDDGSREVGCTRWDAREIVVLAFGAACPEATALPHEVGHVALGGDRRHEDPRWCDRAFWVRMRGALAPSAPPGCALDDLVEWNLERCGRDEERDD